jgi:hypothetical protein
MATPPFIAIRVIGICAGDSGNDKLGHLLHR